MLIAEGPSRTASRTTTTVSWGLTVVTALFLGYIAVVKLLRVPYMEESVMAMGFTRGSTPIVGATLAVCLLVYLVPRTEILGAVMLTGFLGGALCAHFRIGMPVFPNYVMVVGTGVLAWLPLYLRNDLVRKIVKIGR
ncbi:DoxX family protein [Amycolatopsis sp. OK19-0408]|uniref:DoxX family protein n=1 Tax=Amycolatopsis iheyensis TaxID=2945988 RepID=A0A9X2N709_9PSEU|nr:DoxX family protein [Amycolatopsis iheyensis]MCR6483496.1 DoxX family protein [Amycolatopsis iheyensis]